MSLLQPELALLLVFTPRVGGLDIPLDVEQSPTITVQTQGPVIALPSENSFSMRCEAKGNPQPVYRWTKDGQKVDVLMDLGVKNERNNGSFVIQNSDLKKFQGKYQCFASNKLGTAMSEEIQFVVPNVPRFPKENIPPNNVEEGQPVILECNPPQGIPPPQIYWTSLGLHQIDQDERVSMGHDGNLYFSNALLTDSRSDYCCIAAFSATRTIVQKTPVSVVVKSSDDEIKRRGPRLMTPPGVQSELFPVKGEELVLECIAEGFPTPVIEWKRLGEELPKLFKIKNYGKRLIIPKVVEEDTGQYTCKARNSVGVTEHMFIITVEERPKWYPQYPEGQLSVVGSEVKIECPVSGKPAPVISWRRNGEPLKDDPQLHQQVFHNTIMLHSVRPEDSAVYQCNASNIHGSIMANVNIMIMNLAPRILTKNYKRYSIVEGRDVLMDCKVFSSPPPIISWNKDDSKKSVEMERFSFLKNGSLQINQAGKEDSGEYICHATNSEGDSAMKALLDVKDRTHIVQPPRDLQILSGTNAHLPCQAEYDTSLRMEFEIVWSKDGEDITPLLEQSRYFLDNGALHIISVNQSDKGTYTCTVKTSLDQDTASALVTVLDVPDEPTDLELSDLRNRSVRLAWVPGDDHNSSITEFIVEYEESQWDPGTWRELQRVPGNQATVLLALQGHLNYQFRIYAVNAIGKGPPSKPTGRYKTDSAVPDKNPENIKIEGHLPHQVDVSWEPLLPVEHNGPGLEYKVSYRRLDTNDTWTEHLVKRHTFVVKDTPTFVPYEFKIQSRNSKGWGPEPEVVTGFSGEDFPTAAPQDVAVEVINTTLLRVSWTRVAQETVQGHLGGYNVHWLRKRSLLHSNRIADESNFLKFPGNRSHAMVSGLKPFSEYRLTVNVFNKRGNGPNSDPVIFQTPEGVPEQVHILTASNAQRESITLVWAPPFEVNGILTGYRLQYELINDTLEVRHMQEVNISDANTTRWLVENLEEMRGYMFYLSACTKEGCGPSRMEEASTVTDASLSSRHGRGSSQGLIIGMMCGVAFLTLAVLIACFVSHNKSGKYAVKENEDRDPEVETHSMNDDIFYESSDSDSDYKPLNRKCSLDGAVEANSESLDSLNSVGEYGDEECQISEDGSFIGEYSLHQNGGSVAESIGLVIA
ncbi:hypothetical protein UPYG_G00009590 [Umbra pygmaea]|uniref:Neural cell adhesion molecule L1-like protein n=1 Tax=Umbra pygmaea TaxID=75934 RepID=A0ABD0XIG7_UMBPY